MLDDTKRIAVVGLSAWYPCGRDTKELWWNVVARRRAFRRLPDRRLSRADYFDADPSAPDKTYLTTAAVIDGFEFDWVSRRVPRQVFECADTAQWLALEMAIRAIEDSGHSKDDLPRERTGVVVGNTLTGEVSRANGLRLRWPYIAKTLRAAAQGLGYGELEIDELLGAGEEILKTSFPPITEDTLPGVIPNTIAGRICNYFDFKGGGYAVDGACSSSLIALARASDALMDGSLDVALAGGVDISIDPFELVGFSKIGALAKEDMYVYEQRSQGFFPGEGCGFAVLKRLADARRDGDFVYGTINGWGMSSDGRGGLTAPSIGGQALAVSRAYERAGYGLHDCAFIEGHGTGTVVGDMTELSALVKALGDKNDGKKRLGVTAIKSMIGHTKAAAGIGSFVKAVLAVNQRVVPPISGCDRPHDVFKGTSLFPIVDGEVHEPTAVMRAGVSSFGFGGINVHITVESADAPKPELIPPIEPRALFASSQDAETFLFAADSWAALTAHVTPIAAYADGISTAEMADLSAKLAAELDPVATYRAAVVATSPDDLATKLSTLLCLLEAPPAEGKVEMDPSRDVWLAAGVSNPKVAFVFPGQGSQKIGMAGVLRERFPWAREAAANASQDVGPLHGASLEDAIWRKTYLANDDAELAEYARFLTQTEVCQPAICLASVLWTKWLARLGITPVAVGGHSLGELTAFWAAGALSERELFHLAALRGASMAAPAGEAGTMASLRCSSEDAERLVADVSGYAVVANVNSDRQVVVSGAPDAIEELLGLAKDRGIAGQKLSVSNAFHSRYVEGASAQVRAGAKLPDAVEALRTKLYTGLDGSQVKDGAPLKAHFADQIVRKVDFVSLGASVAAEADFIVEVGPGRVLSGLLQNNRGAGKAACLSIEGEPGKFRQANQVLAAFFVRGGDLDLEALFENRLVFPFVSPDDRQFIVNPCEKPLTLPDMQASPRLRGGFESILPERTGLPLPALQEYLQKRGSFLADIVKADLLSTPLGAELLAGLPTAVTATVVAKPNGATKKTAAKAAPAPVERTIEDILIDLVVERTGFPRESIKPEMTLLNDLNIESIAAGDTIGRAAHMVGVGGIVDPGKLLTASLKDVAAAIRAAKGGGAETASGPAPGPRAAAPTEQEALLDALEKLQKKSTWVRPFRIDFTPESLPADDAAYASLAGGTVVVVAQPADGVRAKAIAEAFGGHGAEVRTVSFDEVAAEKTTPKVLVAVMPDGAPHGDAQLRAAMGRVLSPALRIGNVEGALMFVQPATAGASASAFAASVHHERPDLRVRVVDHAEGIELGRLGAAVVREAVTDASFTRAAYAADGARSIPRPVVQDLSDVKSRGLTWTADDVIVVTGGAKGVTAEIALAVAERTGAQTVLLGRSKKPEAGDASESGAEILKTLERFVKLGRTVRYYPCDVADAEAVKRTLAEVTKELGPIRAVVHGAGVNRPAIVGMETIDESCETVAPKALGLMNLLDALKEAPPKIVVALSSIIGVTGMPGNAWYGFSNELIDRLLVRFGAEHPECAVMSLAYSLWDEVGMGQKLGRVADQIRKMGTSAIPVKDAVAHFLAFFDGDIGAKHLVIAARLNGLDTWCPDRGKEQEGRFLEEVMTGQPGVELVTRVHLTLDADGYLRDHVYKGTYLFPMVFGLEAMAEVVQRVVRGIPLGHIRIDNVDLQRPIVVDPKRGERILIHAEVLPKTPGTDERRIEVGIAAEQTSFAVDHFRATFVLGAKPAEVTSKIQKPEKRLPIDPVADLYGRFLFHGPQFQRLQSFYVLKSDYCVFESEHRGDDVVGKLVLGDPFFRDSLLQAGQIVISQERGLPRSIGRIEVFPVEDGVQVFPVVEGILSERTKEHVVCNIKVVDKDTGRILQTLERCMFSIIEHRPDEPTAEEIADPDLRDQRLVQKTLGDLATSFGMKMPSVAIANLPGLHGLGAEERHSREQFVLDAAVARHTHGSANGRSGNGNG